jgi:hypothetical protein
LKVFHFILNKSQSLYKILNKGFQSQNHNSTKHDNPLVIYFYSFGKGIVVLPQKANCDAKATGAILKSFISFMIT